MSFGTWAAYANDQWASARVFPRKLAVLFVPQRRLAFLVETERFNNSPCRKRWNELFFLRTAEPRWFVVSSLPLMHFPFFFEAALFIYTRPTWGVASKFSNNSPNTCATVMVFGPAVSPSTLPLREFRRVAKVVPSCLLPTGKSLIWLHMEICRFLSPPRDALLVLWTGRCSFPPLHAATTKYQWMLKPPAPFLHRQCPRQEVVSNMLAIVMGVKVWRLYTHVVFNLSAIGLETLEPKH